MAALLITAVAGTGASTGHLSERGGNPAVDPRDAIKPESGKPRSEKCHARKGLQFYVRRHNEWRSKMGAGSTPARSRRRASSGKGGIWATGAVSTRPPCPLYLAKIWRKRAWIARQTYEAWAALQAKRLRNPTYAICHVFGRYCSEALRVASCESGRGVYASNGQYLGMFQMGDYARDKYGHSSTALGQAKAAYAYFVDSGRDWSPWSCKP